MCRGTDIEITISSATVSRRTNHVCMCVLASCIHDWIICTLLRPEVGFAVAIADADDGRPLYTSGLSTASNNESNTLKFVVVPT